MNRKKLFVTLQKAAALTPGKKIKTLEADLEHKNQIIERLEDIKKKLEADLAGYILTHKADSEHITHLEEKARQSKKIVMSNARRLARKKSVLNWVLYMEIFGTGSNTAQRACEDLGIDPDATTF